MRGGEREGGENGDHHRSTIARAVPDGKWPAMRQTKMPLDDEFSIALSAFAAGRHSR
jgi:hypothetical protein